MKQKNIKQLNNNKFSNSIICADTLEILKKMPDASVDHCITDPPYSISGYDGKKKIGWLESNNYWTEKKKFKKIDEKWDKFEGGSYDEFTKAWLTEIIRIVKPNGNIVIFGSYHNIYKIGNLLQRFDRRIVNSIVWFKRNAFPNVTQRMLCESLEHIIWAVNNDSKKAKNWTFNYRDLKESNVKVCPKCNVVFSFDYQYCPYCGGNKFEKKDIQMRNMWDIPSTPKSEKKLGGHPSQKPLAVISRLVKGLSKENELIIDPFMGSGTLPVAAKINNRRYIGIDNIEEYCKIAKKRLLEILF